MKNIFKKLNKGNNHDPNRSNEIPSSSSSAASPSCATDHHRNLPVQSPTASPGNTSSAAVPPAAVAANRQDYFSSEEEFQVQLALAISASNSDFRDDQSLGSHQNESSRNEDSVAEALSRHYWEYNVLDYEEKVIDGFYDVYGLNTNLAMQGKMPSLTDLEAKPESSGFEVVIVDRTIDSALEELVQIAQCIALDCPVTEVGILVQRLAELVTSHMGGPVKDANIIVARWTERSTELRTSLHTSVLPLGSINIGLSRHRALLFKVLADNINMPCRLVKGSHYTGIEDDAVNIIKLEDEREFLVDLMAAPGMLIPADISSAKDTSFNPYNPKVLPSLPTTKETDFSYKRLMPLHGEGSSQNSVTKGGSPPLNGKSYFDKPECMPSNFGLNGDTGVGPSKMPNTVVPNKLENFAQSSGASLYKGTHGMNVAGDGTRLNVNVVPYGQNSSDESRNLFADLNPFQIKGASKTSEHNKTVENKAPELQRARNNTISGPPPVPLMWKNRYAYNEVPGKINRVPNQYNPSLLVPNSSSISEKIDLSISKPSYNSNINNDRNAPTRVTGSVAPSGVGEMKRVEDLNVDCNRGKLENSQNDMVKGHENIGIGHLDQRKCTHDRFMGNKLKLKDPESRGFPVDSITNKIDRMMDDVDVSECEIPWEDLVIGERIGLGSYGKVFQADWNGTVSTIMIGHYRHRLNCKTFVDTTINSVQVEWNG